MILNSKNHFYSLIKLIYLKTFFKASWIIVAGFSKSSLLWALEIKQNSNWLGGMKIPFFNSILKYELNFLMSDFLTPHNLIILWYLAKNHEIRSDKINIIITIKK
jgi:hypothetical protein